MAVKLSNIAFARGGFTGETKYKWIKCGELWWDDATECCTVTLWIIRIGLMLAKPPQQDGIPHIQGPILTVTKPERFVGWMTTAQVHSDKKSEDIYSINIECIPVCTAVEQLRLYVGKEE